METWQFRSMDWTGSAGRALAMRRCAANVGTAAYGRGATSSMRNESSGMALLENAPGSLLQLFKEARDRSPDLGAARKPAPLHPDQSYKAETLVNRCDEIGVMVAHPVHEKRFHEQIEPAQVSVLLEARVQ